MSHPSLSYSLFLIFCIFLLIKRFIKTRNTFCRTRSSESVQCDLFIFDHVTFIQFKIRNLLLCTKFHENPMIFHWDMAIYRFSKWRPSAILKLFYHHTRPPTKSLLLAAAGCQLSCQSDTQIWRYSYLIFFRIFGLECLFRPNWGLWGNLNP